MVWRVGIQTLVGTIYPTTCLSCGTPVEGKAGLCSKCWLGSNFIAGLVCNTCGAPLPGASLQEELCDACIQTPRNWAAARATFLYQGDARKLIWELKYADRAEIATAAGLWLLKALQPIVPENPIIVPVPLHWSRLFKRKYNQSELLSASLAKTGQFQHMPALLRRIKRTPPLIGFNRQEREAHLQGAIKLQMKLADQINGRHIILVDDVMTTGSTLSAAAEACLSHNVASVRAVFLARATKND